MNDETLKEYVVTEQAGIYVAGRRSPGEGKPIRLNAKQAETPLRNGEIVDPSAKSDNETKGKSKGGANNSGTKGN